YGDIIHNETVIGRYRAQGVLSVDDVRDVPVGKTLVIRAHGAPRAVFELAEARGLHVIDATCPFVSRIHRIVEGASNRGRKVIVLGNAEHPEVIGIAGWCDGAVVYRDVAEMKADDANVSIVVQTTYDRKKFEDSLERIRELYPNSEIYNTICRATEDRQKAARKLAEISDIMVVIGDMKSSNTKELKKICSMYTDTVMVQTEDELVMSKFIDKQRIGVIAGASTPDDVISAVIQKLDKERTLNDE
ncbi:MAG: 4-hydroxy-3-methylbut-2-enyl diphosphate reductase, partial [Bacillota bacterium]|nr:4-hydroxy-3-methylbut-2-enyl diphosphate reductase [Bacillota bacterium]